MCFAQAKGVSVAEKGLDVLDNPKAALGALSVNSVSGEGGNVLEFVSRVRYVSIQGARSTYVDTRVGALPDPIAGGVRSRHELIFFLPLRFQNSIS